MKYILLLLLFFQLFGCKTSEIKENVDNVSTQQDSLSEEILEIDQLIALCNDLNSSVKDVQMNTYILVTVQQKNDSKNKLQLIESEKKCRQYLKSFQAAKRPIIIESYSKIKIDIDSLLSSSKEIRELLPDFASYENPINVFMAKVLTEPDGEFEKLVATISMQINHLKDLLEKEKKKINTEMKKLR